MGGLQSLRDTSLLVHILVSLFGIGSWLNINGVWVELPILVVQLPEGWNLGSYLTIIIQVANIGPLLYTIGHLLAPKLVSERPVVYIILVVGAVTCLLLAFLWGKTTYVGGAEHSTALLVLTFFLGTVDCTSSIVFLTFMSIFKTSYMTSYFIGEGLSGLVPSLVALAQGVGIVTCHNVSSTNATFNDGVWFNETSYYIQTTYYPPRFTPMAFYIVMSVLMAVSICSFTMLNYLPLCKREQVSNVYEVTMETPDDILKPTLTLTSGVFSTNASKRHQAPVISKSSMVSYSTFKEVREDKGLKPKTLTSNTMSVVSVLLLLAAWVNALGSGVLPSLQPYASLPYGNETYHLAVTLAQIANPVSCFVSFLFCTKSKDVIVMLTLLSTGVAAYILTVAALGPIAILVGQTSGEALAIVSQVLAIALITYTKLSIATVCRDEGRRALLWFGVVTQVGSLLGAIVSFLLINVIFLFKSAPSCPLEVVNRN